MFKIKVTLLSHTPDPEKVVASAARLCYSAKCGAEIMDNFSAEEIERFLTHLRSLGHLSPFEHASFTFAIDGVSRVLSHQLVRHRIGTSYSQKSQRYVKEGQFEYTIPDTIANNRQQQAVFEQTMTYLQDRYNELLAAGIPAEDARYLLPNACTTNLVVTMNARSLLHFFELRCCMRAQKEIRQLADLMLAEVIKIAPLLFANAGAPCTSIGICFEGDLSCGRAKTIKPRR